MAANLAHATHATHATYTLTCPVVLVGFMGAGKTSVARRLARNLRLTSVDADAYFANSVGMPASEFIRTHGQDAFRERESAVLRELLGMVPAIISCGGGVVERAENRALLSRHLVVFLRVSADEARTRISSLETRPLFGDAAAARALHERREALYEEVATFSVDTAGKSVAAVARAVQRCLEERGILCPQ